MRRGASHWSIRTGSEDGAGPVRRPTPRAQRRPPLRVRGCGAAYGIHTRFWVCGSAVTFSILPAASKDTWNSPKLVSQ